MFSYCIFIMMSDEHFVLRAVRTDSFKSTGNRSKHSTAEIRTNPSTKTTKPTMLRPAALQLALLRSSRFHYVRSRRFQAVRFYLGGAGEGRRSVSEGEEALYQAAKPRSDAIMAEHTSMPDIAKIPKQSFDPQNTVASDDMALDIRRKRLVYRSKQRGWLEVDLLLGTWASENVPTLNAKELDEFEAFVNTETIDIYNVITLRLDVPDEWKTASGNGIVERIQNWAKSNPLGKADPEKYKQVKAAAKLI
jgi:succinate dehydrogenase assembly factor 2